GAGEAAGEPAGSHRAPSLRGVLVQGDRRAARCHRDRGEGACPSGLRAPPHAARAAQGARMTDCDRFLEALASDRLDQASRDHARGCAVCGPLLPEPAPVAVTAGASLSSVHGRVLEELRTTPLRPWTRDAAPIALLQGAVAGGVSGLSGARTC